MAKMTIPLIILVKFVCDLMKSFAFFLLFKYFVENCDIVIGFFFVICVSAIAH